MLDLNTITVCCKFYFLYEELLQYLFRRATDLKLESREEEGVDPAPTWVTQNY